MTSLGSGFVQTKLGKDALKKLLEYCIKHDITPYQFAKEAILEKLKIDPKDSPQSYDRVDLKALLKEMS